MPSYAETSVAPGYGRTPERPEARGKLLPPARLKAAPGDRAPVVKPRKVVTPYGDFCTRCSKYGMGKSTVKRDKAVEAIRHYFISKGFRISNIRGKGRFLKVDIFKNGDLVDRVIFDRRTGRLRSIY